jgi:hypothetical protein
VAKRLGPLGRKTPHSYLWLCSALDRWRARCRLAGYLSERSRHVSGRPAERRSEVSQELTIRSAVERGPRFKAPLRI